MCELAQKSVKITQKSVKIVDFLRKIGQDFLHKSSSKMKTRGVWRFFRLKWPELWCFMRVVAILRFCKKQKSVKIFDYFCLTMHYVAIFSYTDFFSLLPILNKNKNKIKNKNKKSIYKKSGGTKIGQESDSKMTGWGLESSRKIVTKIGQTPQAS